MSNKIMRRNINFLVFIGSFCLPLICLVILSQYLKTWIIDDAGISFVYSRSLANGYGLVTQPGAEPVEGYSNFLWVLVMSPFFLINSFDPQITPKIVAYTFVGITFFLVTRICLLLKKNSWHALIINGLIAINAPFIIWTSSGLENPLYVMLICFTIYLAIKYTLVKSNRIIIAGAFATFLVLITRPDGVFFVLLFPVAILSAKMGFRNMIKPFVLYGSLIVLFVGGLTLFRWFYFHDILPNTYYAKEGSVLNVINGFIIFKNELYKKYLSVFRSLGGSDLIYFVYAIAGLLFIRLVVLRKRFKWNFVLLSAWTLSFLIYMLLPYDWMGEYRFATPFVVVSYLCFTLALTGMPDISSKLKLPITILLLVFLGIYATVSFSDHYKRLVFYSKNPAVSLQTVKLLHVNKFNGYIKLLDLKNASLLIPDVGATYYYSELRVYDAAGLCDKTIAKGKYSKNRKLVHDYIFRQIKPTFIHLQDGWTAIIRPDEDPAFRKDYIVIHESLSEDLSKYHGVTLYSGEYIRKDAINDQNRIALQGIIH